MEEIIRLTGKEAEEFRRYREEKERKAMREQNRDAYKQLVDETYQRGIPYAASGQQRAGKMQTGSLCAVCRCIETERGYIQH